MPIHGTTRPPPLPTCPSPQHATPSHEPLEKRHLRRRALAALGVVAGALACANGEHFPDPRIRV